MFVVGIVGTAAVLGGAAVIATSCLDRGRSTQGTSTTTITSGEMEPSGAVNDSTGGAKALSTATTELPGGAPTAESMPETDLPPPAGHADHQSYDPNARSTPMPAPPMTAPLTDTPPPPASAGDGGTSSVTAPATNMSRGQAVTGASTPSESAETRSPSFAAGAGKFVTEAPPDRASSWTSNPEAGAGPFTTDRSTPPEPIWYGAPSGSQAPR